jgi:hypothetical protein
MAAGAKLMDVRNTKAHDGLMIKNEIINDIMSRVERLSPIRQVDVCFLRFPSGFPTVPHYVNHVSVTWRSKNSFFMS